jgi:sulfate permease, SulP family
MQAFSNKPPVLSVARLWPWLHRVNKRSLRLDAQAGLLGMVLSLPQGIAFASLAGLPIEFGVYTSIVPCIVAALFGSSWHVTSGPTNAISLAMLAMLAPLAAVGSAHYIALALTVTLLVGCIQLGVGVLRLGSIANFISPVALFGFTAGAALLIAMSALPEALGLDAVGVHGALQSVSYAVTHAAHTHWASVLAAATTVVVAVALKRWRPTWPHMLLGLMAATALSVVLPHAMPHAMPNAQMQTVGHIPSPFPPLSWPVVSLRDLPELVGLALALSLVALGQSVSIAKALADRSGQRIDANREFVGQGLSNVVGAFFSCYVSCGSLNRSVPNYEAGAQTPLAAVFSAAFMLALVGVASTQLAQIPVAAIAGLLMLVAWSLLDVPRWMYLWRVSRRDLAIAALTLLATVTLRLEYAIVLGALLSLMVFLYRTANPAMRRIGFDTHDQPRRSVVLADSDKALPECPQLTLLRMEGDVYFGAVQSVSDRLQRLREMPGAAKHLLVMAKSMNYIDLAGAQLWAQELGARRSAGGDVYFHRPRSAVVHMWQATGFDAELGSANVFGDKGSAIAHIVPRLDPNMCKHCQARVFQECAARPGPTDPR